MSVWRKLYGWPFFGGINEGEVLGISGSSWQGLNLAVMGFATAFFDEDIPFTVTQGAGTIVIDTAVAEITRLTAVSVDDSTAVLQDFIDFHCTFDTGTAGTAGSAIEVSFDAIDDEDEFVGLATGYGYVVLNSVQVPCLVTWVDPVTVTFTRQHAPTDFVGADPNAGLVPGDAISIQIRRRWREGS